MVELVIPYERGDVLAAVHREGEVVSTAHTDDGVRVRARLDDAAAGRLAEFARRLTTLTAGRRGRRLAARCRAASGRLWRS